MSELKYESMSAVKAEFRELVMRMFGIEFGSF